MGCSKPVLWIRKMLPAIWWWRKRRWETHASFLLSISVQLSQDASTFEMLPLMQMHLLSCKSAISLISTPRKSAITWKIKVKVMRASQFPWLSVQRDVQLCQEGTRGELRGWEGSGTCLQQEWGRGQEFWCFLSHSHAEAMGCGHHPGASDEGPTTDVTVIIWGTDIGDLKWYLHQRTKYFAPRPCRNCGCHFGQWNGFV